MKNEHHNHRIIVLSIFIFGLLAILIAQFFRIQIIEGEKWEKIAQKQHFIIIKEPFQRGKFISNTSIKKNHPEVQQSFVIDVETYHLYIDPKSIPGKFKDTIADKIIKILEISAENHPVIKKQFFRKSRSRKIAMWVDKEFRDTILEWWLPYSKKNKISPNALFFVNDYRRSYPFGKLLGQVLHTIQLQKDEKTFQAIPTGGLELMFNTYLKGKQGKRCLMRSPRNSFETGSVISYPENGADVYLTINHCLQAIAEDELEKGVKKCNAKGGWVIMMNPRTGEILALAQYPFFNLSDYQLYFNNEELIENTKVKAITDANEPGSVMKPFTLAASFIANKELSKNGKKPVLDPAEKVATSKGQFKGRPKPLTDTHLHYFLNMDMALQKSSNIYMAILLEKIIDQLGKEWYRNILTECFGFGQKTGVELPAESCGVLPKPGKKHPNGALEWSPATPYSIAMGHNVQTTSLQLARAFSIFANGGYLVQPTLIRKIVKTLPDGTQKIIMDHTMQNWRDHAKKVLDEDVVEAIVKAMKYTTKLGGTSTRASIFGYTEVGKTGSANKVINGGYSADKFCSSFVGFTPAKNPEFVVLVTMDEPQYGYIAGIGKMHMGGVCAAPVFREICTRALNYLGIPPDDPHGYPPGDPRYDALKADWVEETRKLQEMYESWNNKSPKH